ncbi:MAG: metallophosphoesterase [Gracilimonas sp.]|nr:metallophosphoesterase [Gracilimonas sp.]
MSDRRSFLKKLGLSALGLGTLSYNGKESDDEVRFRVVHLTDQHVTSRRKGHEGYKKCVESINALSPSPDLVLMGGDMVFDGLYTELDTYKESIDLYKEISSKLNMPHYPCIGNHDVLGLSSRRKVSADHPGIGRKMIMDELDMKNDYYSFNHKGWHFVVLNSIHEMDGPNGPSYEARISKEQLDWLRYDLGDHADKPSIVVSHLAAFSHKGQINNDFEMKAMSPIILQNNIDLRYILERHNVKAMLQGHTHISEDFRFNDVWYITSQAASAAWWGGNWLGFKPGYTVLELGDEDIINWYPVTYDWEHQLEPDDTVEKQRIQDRIDLEQRQDSLYNAEIKS